MKDFSGEDKKQVQPLLAAKIVNGREEDLKEDGDGDNHRKKSSHHPNNKSISTWGLYTVLFCLIFVNFGSHTSFDTHQLLEDYFLIHFNISPKKVVQLYAVFHSFAVPTGLVTGFIISWISPMLSCLIFSFLSLISGFLCTWGVSTKNYTLMLIGRAFSGFGAEATEIAQYTLISMWFQGKFLSIASGLGQFMNNLAITLAMLYSSKIFQASRDMVTVYAVVAFMAAASVIGIMVFAYFDIKYGKPTSVDQGGSSINPHGGPVTCKSFKFLNRKIIWIAVVNTWFAQ